jgi:hypothetical protein
MRDNQVQIFISYARRDDTPTGKVGSLGFIVALREQLGHILEKQGYPEPHIWRDKEQIEEGDYFNPVLEKAIANSDLMVVVLSRNWINRPNCRKELELFQHRWQGMKERVIVVRRNLVDEGEVPELLRGTEGFRFFRFRNPREPEPGSEIYFDRDSATENEFYNAANSLGGYLWRAAKHRCSIGSARVTTAPVASGRTVYLAKPAPDMTKPYEFLANNLENEGYRVVPPRDQIIPLDSSAQHFVDGAMAQADTSIHLLGEDAGYAPSKQDPIVTMQLARAQARAAADSSDQTAPKFRQIIWAPKLLDGSANFRDPTEVLKNFGSGIDGYKLMGDVQSSFWIALRQLLNRPEMHAPAEAPIGPQDMDSRIYIYHRTEDRDFAVNIAEVLRNKDANIVLPPMQGTDVERSECHKQYLRSCDTVLLCWAEATDVWAKMSLDEFRSWQTLGRTGKFRIRGLVLGPPPGVSKAPVALPPKSDYDRLLDFTEHPNPEALGALLTGAPPPVA